MNIWHLVQNPTINLNTLKYCLQEYTSDIWQTINIHHETPFHLAIINFQDIDILKLMLQHGAYLSWRMKDKTGLTPLHNAMVYQQNLDIFKLLFKYGASCAWTNTNYSYFFDHTPLYYAIIYQNNIENIKFFFENGAYDAWRISNHRGNTILHEIISDLKYNRIPFRILERIMKYIPSDLFDYVNDEGAMPLDRISLSLRNQIINEYNKQLKTVFKFIAKNSLEIDNENKTTIYDMPSEILNSIFQKMKIKEPVSHVKVTLVNSYQDRLPTMGAHISQHMHNA